MREDARDLMNEEAFQAKDRKVDIVTRCLTPLVKYMM